VQVSKALRSTSSRCFYGTSYPQGIPLGNPRRGMRHRSYPMSVIASEAKQSPHRRTSRSTSYPKGIPVGTRVCDRILIMVRFFKVRSAYRIPILILNNERTSYVSRSSFVSQVRLAEAAFAKHIIPVLLRDIVPVRGYHPGALTGSPWDEPPFAEHIVPVRGYHTRRVPPPWGGCFGVIAKHIIPEWGHRTRMGFPMGRGAEWSS
jgi:hypothetical protein